MNTSDKQSILNSENISTSTSKIAKVEQDLQNWNIPKEPFKSVYETGKFDFIKSYNIKTCESTIAINNSKEVIKLLASQDINRYKKDFKFLHIVL